MNISLNCDLGEGFSNDAFLMPYLWACNIACGGHFGNVTTIEQSVQLAQKHQVNIGAHTSYPDVENFGRVSLNISAEDLIQSLQQQLKLFEEVLEKQTATFHHIKAHGALYNDVAKDAQKAKIYLKAINHYKKDCLLFVPPNSAILKIAKQQGFLICVEAFADRTYNDDLSLLSRNLPNANIHQPEKALQQVLSIIKNEEVITINNRKIELQADTFCVHSDTENALAIVQHLHQFFNKKDIE